MDITKQKQARRFRREQTSRKSEGERSTGLRDKPPRIKQTSYRTHCTAGRALALLWQRNLQGIFSPYVISLKYNTKTNCTSAKQITKTKQNK